MKMMTDSRDHDITEMAKTLGTSPRSVYRYIDTFKEAGFVVIKQDSSVYKLGKEGTLLEGFDDLLHFTREEANIFNQLLTALDDTNALKSGLRRKIAAVCECTKVQAGGILHKNAQNIAALREARDNGRCAILHGYSSANSQRVSDRRVEPFEISETYTTVTCYDIDSKSVKMFKTARIDTVTVCAEPWEHRDEHVSLFTDIFGMMSARTKTVTLRIGMRAHNLLREEYPKSINSLRQDGPKNWILETPISDYAGIGRFVLGLAEDIEIIAPKELKDYLRERVANMKF